MILIGLSSLPCSALNSVIQTSNKRGLPGASFVRHYIHFLPHRSVLSTNKLSQVSRGLANGIHLGIAEGLTVILVTRLLCGDYVG